MFYNTLFHQNPSFHLPIPSPYTFNIKPRTQITTQQKIPNPLNHSNIHQHFIIPTPHLTIYPIFQHQTKQLLFKNRNSPKYYN
ncbi:aminopeptidase [Staphylococcus epidermidis]|uniref:aminopeptidase n=1 Tax=Staphylococcus epidermidis TaxID=1282 RepID=UPI0037D9E035